MSTKFKCDYCGKEFTRERTLQVHMCEPKRRHLQKNEKWVQNGFIVFQRFYEIHQKNSKPKTYDDFCKSAYYNAFVKFGRYVMHTSPLYFDKYVDYDLQFNKSFLEPIKVIMDTIGWKPEKVANLEFLFG